MLNIQWQLLVPGEFSESGLQVINLAMSCLEAQLEAQVEAVCFCPEGRGLSASKVSLLHMRESFQLRNEPVSKLGGEQLLLGCCWPDCGSTLYPAAVYITTP